MDCANYKQSGIMSVNYRCVCIAGRMNLYCSLGLAEDPLSITNDKMNAIMLTYRS